MEHCLLVRHLMTEHLSFVVLIQLRHNVYVHIFSALRSENRSRVKIKDTMRKIIQRTKTDS